MHGRCVLLSVCLGAVGEPSAVLTHAGVVVGCQLEASVALAVVGAGRVHAAVVAVRGQGALVDVWGTKNTS